MRRYGEVKDFLTGWLGLLAPTVFTRNLSSFLRRNCQMKWVAKTNAFIIIFHFKRIDFRQRNDSLYIFSTNWHLNWKCYLVYFAFQAVVFMPTQQHLSITILLCLFVWCSFRVMISVPFLVCYCLCLLILDYISTPLFILSIKGVKVCQ